MTKLFSLITDPPPGFCYTIPNKRELLTSHIALFVNRPEDAYALLADFKSRVRGLLITIGSDFCQQELGPYLWHISVPDDYLPLLQKFIGYYLDIMKKANQENDKNLILIADMAYNGQFLSQTRDGYNLAMDRLQVKMDEVKHENEKRREAIRQLNHEISQRKKAQQEQLRLEARLHQAQKMEAIGLMAGGVAHDLNNILAGVVGYPDLLLLTIPKDSKLRQPLQRIKESGERAADVITDLLTIARSAACPSEVANINFMIQEYLGSLEFNKLKSRHQQVSFRLDLQSDLANNLCSKPHIKKCLMNIIVNGAEAIDQEGTVQISTYNQDVEQELAIGDQLLAKGHYAVIRVTDSGKGIAKDHLDHIFEPFYSRKKMGRSGTGLGLTVVWNTVQDHGGIVQVESSPEGTSFMLFFPSSNKPLPLQAKEIPLAELQGNKEIIMVVDDEQLPLDIAKSMLAQLNYKVVTKASGEDAIAYLQDNKVDLLVLDMVMNPGLNGRQTYEQILAVRPEQKAIIASGFAENDETNKVLGLGAHGFLRKPYPINGLGKAVKEALRARQ